MPANRHGHGHLGCSLGHRARRTDDDGDRGGEHESQPIWPWVSRMPITFRARRAHDDGDGSGGHGSQTTGPWLCHQNGRGHGNGGGWNGGQPTRPWASRMLITAWRREEPTKTAVAVDGAIGLITLWRPEEPTTTEMAEEGTATYHLGLGHLGGSSRRRGQKSQRGWPRRPIPRAWGLRTI